MDVLVQLGLATDQKSGSEHVSTCFELLNAEWPEEKKTRQEHFADKPWFNLLVGFGIVLNTLLLGVDVDSQRSGQLEDRFTFFVIDVMFFFAFLAEMSARLHQNGWEYFADPWNFFDFNVVILTLSDLIVSITEGSSGGLKVASAIRMFRLLRIVRNIKGLKVFYGLWQVIQGLIESLRTMLWVSLLLMIIVYVMSIAITTMVGSSQFIQDNWEDSFVYVGTVSRSMWTVMQLITFDAWGDEIARPMMRIAPGATCILFVAIIVCSFGVLNVVIAVMVERALSQGKDNRDGGAKQLDRTEKRLFVSMAKDFSAASSDGSGEVTRDEFVKLVRSENMAFKLRLLGINTDEADDLFNILDDDGSATVSDEEFVQGLQKLKGDAQGAGLVTLISFCHKQKCLAQRYERRIAVLNLKADEIQARLMGVGRNLTSELRDRKVSDEHRDNVWVGAKQREAVIRNLDKTKAITFPGLGSSLPL